MRQLSFSTQSSTFFGSLTFEKSEKSTCTNYIYGFQNQEEDDEIKGEGNSVNYKYRMHDPRLGRFFILDPLSVKYPHNSPYAFSENRVIDAIELEGLESVVYTISRSIKDKSITVKVSEKKLKDSGKLGSGAAVIFDNNGKKSYFYGDKASDIADFVSAFEARRNDVYPSLEGGTPTVGIGHKMSSQEAKKMPVGTKITDAQMDKLFKEDWAEATKILENSSEAKGLSSGQKEALTDFVFNTGSTKDFSKNDGPNFFMGYLKGGDGIVKRRLGEFFLYRDNNKFKFDVKRNDETKKYLDGLVTGESEKASENKPASVEPPPMKFESQAIWTVKKI